MLSLLFYIITGQPKVKKVKNFLPFLKHMKRPQTKFHTHTMKESQVIRSKKVKIYHWVKIYPLGQLFMQHSFFLNLLYILLKLQQQILICFCKFSLHSVIIMGLLRFLTS